MGGGGGQQNSTTTTSIDPAIKPYVTYGLEEAKRLYETGSPQFFPGQTYVSPSEQTQQALQMAQQRAMAGSPLTGAAQAETLATIQGKGVNPFLAGALEQTNRLAGEQFNRNIQNLQSSAASAGRYGSSAMGQQAGTAQDIFARALAEQGGQLAYNSAEAERARQMAAVGAAPQMAQADYADIQRLLSVGGAKEAQSAAELQDAMNRFNFQQNLPQMKLQQYANLYSSAPQGSTTTQTATPQGGK
ncbi:hypothetical protein UFOVP177_7 [uncultured Caudovirales phage]|uniref:Uncharacterized protein n=1 Tax=uncultured Caudovirales phage TaxID=2100421 RepID=A0A6J7WAD5_9CAUD|nr:hypothetical protein UFOVP177_7 [uncultured Caudovirales phage]